MTKLSNRVILYLRNVIFETGTRHINLFKIVNVIRKYRGEQIAQLVKVLGR